MPRRKGKRLEQVTSDGSQNHRMAWLGRNLVKVTLSNISVMTQDTFQTKLLRASSSLTLNVPRDGASTTCLENLGQCFTTLIVKIFLTSNLN